MLPESAGGVFVEYVYERRYDLSGAGTVIGHLCAQYSPLTSSAYAGDVWYALWVDSPDPATPSWLELVDEWLTWPWPSSEAALAERFAIIRPWWEKAVAQWISGGQALPAVFFDADWQEQMRLELERMFPALDELTVFYGWLGACRRRRRRA
jgi:hypothetical protein